MPGVLTTETVVGTYSARITLRNLLCVIVHCSFQTYFQYIYMKIERVMCLMFTFKYQVELRHIGCRIQLASTAAYSCTRDCDRWLI